MGGCHTEFRGVENPNGMFLLDSWRAGRGWLAGRMGGRECRQGPSGFGSLSSVFIGNEMSLILFTGATKFRGRIEGRKQAAGKAISSSACDL